MSRTIMLTLLSSLIFLVHVSAQQETFRLTTKDRQNSQVDNYTDTIHSGKVYIVSGSLGIGVPLGQAREILTTRLAGSWGMDISLPNRHYVLYPSIDYWSFGYNQRELHEKSSYLVENGRASFYNVNLAIGTRRQFRKLNAYLTAGPSVGMFFEPRATLRPNGVIKNDFDSKIMAGARISAGADYKLNSFFVYVDAGLLHSFSKIQSRPLNVLSLYVGLKTDITRVADKVAGVLGKAGEEKKQ
ncbi:hypothetical protein [Olivibacter sp. XZL3]|uniref:hypothetical protein n=1 Tax=Olivibacter sp. XZL3 TaxID=1735116 RepID=UPI00106507FD|nr:hypothetical protein [Olivibacter sp. XZL3]